MTKQSYDLLYNIIWRYTVKFSYKDQSIIRHIHYNTHPWIRWIHVLRTAVVNSMYHECL